jgi:hypothetical protein
VTPRKLSVLSFSHTAMHIHTCVHTVHNVLHTQVLGWHITTQAVFVFLFTQCDAHPHTLCFY